MVKHNNSIQVIKLLYYIILNLKIWYIIYNISLINYNNRNVYSIKSI